MDFLCELCASFVPLVVKYFNQQGTKEHEIRAQSVREYQETAARSVSDGGLFRWIVHTTLTPALTLGAAIEKPHFSKKTTSVEDGRPVNMNLIDLMMPCGEMKSMRFDVCGMPVLLRLFCLSQ